MDIAPSAPTDKNCCGVSQAALFNGPMYQDQIADSYYEYLDKVTGDKDSTKLEFKITGNKYYIDPTDSFMNLTLRIVKANGDELPGDVEAVDGQPAVPAPNVAPINYIAATLFRQCTIILKDKFIATIPHYGLQAYLQACWSLGKSVKGGWLKNGVYYEDTAGQFDTLGPQNAGFAARKAKFAESKQVVMRTPIHAPLFQQEKFLLNHMPMILSFDLEDAEKILMWPANDPQSYKVQVMKAELCIRRVELDADFDKQVQEKLTADTKVPTRVLYPLVRPHIVTVSIPHGVTTRSLNDFTTGKIPTRIFVGFQLQTTQQGVKNFNPLKFDHFDLQEIDIKFNSKSIWNRRVQIDIEKGDYLDAYSHTVHTVGLLNSPFSPTISLDEFTRGFFVIGADLSRSYCSHNETRDEPRFGSLQVDLIFRTPLAAAISAILYMDYDALLEIDKMRDFVKDYK